MFNIIFFKKNVNSLYVANVNGKIHNAFRMKLNYQFHPLLFNENMYNVIVTSMISEG